MRIRSLLLSAAVGVVVSSSLAFAAPVDNAAIEKAAQEYQSLLAKSREAGERPGQADMGDFTDKVLESIAFSELTLDQCVKVVNSVPIQYSTKSRPALEARLAELAKANDGSGARAAAVRLAMLDLRTKSAERLVELKKVLAHPGLAESFEKGYGSNVLIQANQLDANDLKTVVSNLVELASSVKPSAPVNFFYAAATFQINAARELKDEIKTLEPFRAAASAAGREKLAAGVSDSAEKARLEDAIAKLDGAYAKGMLVGHPAPQIDFLYFNDPSDGKLQAKSLADLKGKVVVLDFWATWCGPCIASFPNVKALSRYYKGFDVVVVGVTSPQGFVVLNGSRVDTSGDVKKEIELTTTDFVKQKEMTWALAVSKQPVFNPDFGITGIPSVAIIDPAGVVRYAGLHPMSGPEGVANPTAQQILDKKISLINPLLGEAKLMIPATMMIPKGPPAKAVD